MKVRRLSIYGLLAIAGLFLATSSYGARVKDIASISGIRDNQLIGYGLVVGLAGTGDDMKNGFTRDTLANMLTRQGLTMPSDKTLKAVNTAAVMVTATLPPFAKQGSKLDIAVSSIGSAKSLGGGILLMTPLRGADGAVYAVAQGAVTLGGYTTSGGGSGAVKNHPAVGRIANGALVEKEIRHELDSSKTLTVNLFQPDFTTSSRLAAAINNFTGQSSARPLDSSSVSVALPADPRGNISEFISLIEGLDVPVDSQAVVVMNENTGTVVMGENVRISTIAVAHGNLSIQISEAPSVSQPQPFAPRPTTGSAPATANEGSVIVASGGQTVVTTNRTATVEEGKEQLVVLPKGVTIQEVVKALNAVGVTPRDLITIMQTIKAAGALQAELRII